MIRLRDAATLAYTKLQTHKIRTGLTAGVAGLLFGAVISVIIITTGVFGSIDSFSHEGLGQRTILGVGSLKSADFRAYDHLDDQKFIDEVEKMRNEYIAKKARLAQKYAIPYDAEREDPSPILISDDTKTRYIDDRQMVSKFVQMAEANHVDKAKLRLDIDTLLQPYHTAKLLPQSYTLVVRNGSFEYMKTGAEPVIERMTKGDASFASGQQPSIAVLNQSAAQPFILHKDFDYKSGEIPVIISLPQAEEMLDYDPLPNDATNQQKLDRLQQVRDNITKATASFCYRNPASQRLLTQALSQQADKARRTKDVFYVAPSVEYVVPAADSCGPVAIAKDSRMNAEKERERAFMAYQKELGEYEGEPVQHKVTLRGIGVAGAVSASATAPSLKQMVDTLLGSWLSYEEKYFVVPSDMLAEVPAASRPSYLFPQQNQNEQWYGERALMTSYLVEFGDKEEARALINKATGNGGLLSSAGGDTNLMVNPFGSSSLIVDEAKTWTTRILLWALVIIGGISLIISASLIGRMVTDGRRESAIFRAIGARRSDIGLIYGMYAFLLSLRVAIVAAAIGLVVAIGIDVWLSGDMTVYARLAYAAVDTTREFHLMSVWSWLIAAVIGAIIVSGLLASIVPILLGARRNPIKDMRDDS